MDIVYPRLQPNNPYCPKCGSALLWTTAENGFHYTHLPNSYCDQAYTLFVEAPEVRGQLLNEDEHKAVIKKWQKATSPMMRTAS